MSDYEYLESRIKDLEEKLYELTKVPEYSFALREDVKDEDQFLPTKGEPNASGWDVRACMEDRQPMVVKPLQYIKVPLGFRGFCPTGWWYELKPRSSTFAKKHIHSLYGTIDSDFENNLIFAGMYIPELKYNSNAAGEFPLDWNTYCKINTLTINFGDAIGQIIPVKRQEMDMLKITNKEYDEWCVYRNSVRGTGGFGSTGS